MLQELQQLFKQGEQRLKSIRSKLCKYTAWQQIFFQLHLTIFECFQLCVNDHNFSVKKIAFLLWGEQCLETFSYELKWERKRKKRTCCIGLLISDVLEWIKINDLHTKNTSPHVHGKRHVVWTDARKFGRISPDLRGCQAHELTVGYLAPVSPCWGWEKFK